MRWLMRHKMAVCVTAIAAVIVALDIVIVPALWFWYTLTTSS